MQWVRTLRQQRGWTALELARRSRIHPSDISRIESGRLAPYQPQVRRLARVLGVSALEFEQTRRV